MSLRSVSSPVFFQKLQKIRLKIKRKFHQPAKILIIYTQCPYHIFVYFSIFYLTGYAIKYIIKK